MKKPLMLIVAFAVVAAACADDDVSVLQPTPGAPTSVAPTSVAPTSTSPPAGAGAAEDPAGVDAGPLYLGLSIHVEGWDEEDRNEAMFDRHAAGVIMMAEVAKSHGAVLTFELTEVFMDAVVRWDSDVVERLEGLGQGTGVHGDIGGRGEPPLAGLVAALTNLRDKAASIGVDTRHVSGVCSRGQWVEAVLRAGFQSTNGAVEYCATSLDPEIVPEGWDLSVCTSPVACHGQLDVDLDLRVHPYLIDSSADFIIPADSGLVLMLGNSGEAVDCAAEARGGGTGCVGTEADIPFLEDLLGEFLAARDPSRVASLTTSWSVGSIPEESFVEAVLGVFDDAVAAGDAAWGANGDVGQIALDSLGG